VKFHINIILTIPWRKQDQTDDSLVIQRHGQPYREFTRRAMAGGVQGYIAFLRGKRVTYWGRTGDQHTEWFPGAGPIKKD
jgi:hypothetical protein